MNLYNLVAVFLRCDGFLGELRFLLDKVFSELNRLCLATSYRAFLLRFFGNSLTTVAA